MNILPHLLYSAEQTRALDRIAIEEHGIPGIVLMERAGAAAFGVLQRRWPAARKIAVLCGAGNNGGDGFVVARLAQQAGLSVTLVLMADPDGLRGEAKQAFASLAAMSPPPTRSLPACLNDFDLLVDAMLGTGLNALVKGEYAEAIASINQSNVPVLALDVPSGLNASSGKVMGCAVQASSTISFIGLNRGLLTGEGPGYCGEVCFSDLALPVQLFERVESDVNRVDFATLQHHFKPRPQHAHKGMCGHVLLIGGEQGMSGAIRLAGEAALRCGSGLVSVATRAQHAALISGQRPELMCHGVEESGELQPLLARADVIVCGPGLGQGAWGVKMLEAVLAQPLPLVLDADALNLLALKPRYRDNWILTPHPAEAARLLGMTTAEVQDDRFAAVINLQQRYGGQVLLKGAGSLMCGPDGDVLLCSDGNPGMASGGMGDVLSGVLGALFAQATPSSHVLPMAVALHAYAGDCAAGKHPIGLLASDLLPHLREGVNPI